MSVVTLPVATQPTHPVIHSHPCSLFPGSSPPSFFLSPPLSGFSLSSFLQLSANQTIPAHSRGWCVPFFTFLPLPFPSMIISSSSSSSLPIPNSGPIQIFGTFPLSLQLHSSSSLLLRSLFLITLILFALHDQSIPHPLSCQIFTPFVCFRNVGNSLGRPDAFRDVRGSHAASGEDLVACRICGLRHLSLPHNGLWSQDEADLSKGFPVSNSPSSFLVV